jgi:quercetin dioxygenase-like cupin family protein
MSTVDTAVANVLTIAREQIRAINTVEIDGEIHNLGEHRDFRRHGKLAEFLPELGRSSFAWVRLRDGETLDVHQHPTKSMILICSGSVQLTGDNPKQLYEGDTICVPPFSKHGFTTRRGETFHGLSIQFEGNGLYEKDDQARVAFNGRHTKNKLFSLFESGLLQREPALRQRFVEALYVWSSYFQRMIHARQAVCADPALREQYGKHFEEEFGHDRLLRERYNITQKVYDPTLEAASNWFVAQMHQLDEAQKIVVVHLVVESSGHVFGLATAEIFGKTAKPGDYFDVHAEADDDHRNIGRDHLEHVSPAALPQLLEVCQHAWDQMDLVHDRIALWTLGHA